MDRTTVLGWEIKSINAAFVSTRVLLHICAHRGQGEEFIIRHISELPRGQASCFAVLVERCCQSARKMQYSSSYGTTMPGLCTKFIISKHLEPQSPF